MIQSASQTPSTALALNDLYAIYLEVARRDHAWRIHALYGETQRPAGHTPLRLLPMEHFRQRYEAALRTPNGHAVFEAQMLRRARAYGVDIQAALGSLRRAA